jgi:glyoxylase-like metal-dependent hydrolase (beta-lactamase superfamily II)
MTEADGGLALREILAPNVSPLTLDGTRTYVVGRRRVVVIDPGPAASSHLDAVVAAVGDAQVQAVALTHAHEDHAGGAALLAERLRAPLRSRAAGTLADGDRLETDAGALIAVATPGHTPDHMAFHWAQAGAVFVGDLMLGGLETALVAAPEGDLGAYLASLERVRALGARVLYPAHGPRFTDPAAALDAYARHREERLRQVLDALERGAAGVGEIVDAVYGAELAADLRGAAAASVIVYLEHLEAAGRVEREAGGRWRLTR